MRIAVMADVHSNHIALEACIAEAEKHHAEQFLFLGDNLGELAYPEKTLELLQIIRAQYCSGNERAGIVGESNGNSGMRT